MSFKYTCMKCGILIDERSKLFYESGALNEGFLCPVCYRAYLEILNEWSCIRKRKLKEFLKKEVN